MRTGKRCCVKSYGIATEKGELNRNIQKANRLIREIRAQIGKLKEWIADLFKARETAPEQPPQSSNLANLLMKYLSVQREKSRKYSQRWQQQHTADELKTIAAAVNYLSEHGISNLDELDAALSSVSDKAYSIREGMKTAEQRMKELQKLIEYGRNYQTYKPIQDEYRQIRWKGKQEKFAEARRAELMLKTVEQMSKISGIGENKLRELMDSGELEYIQNGNRRLIADAAIWDWYHRAKTTAKPPARQGG